MSLEEVSHTFTMHQVLELGDDMSLPDDVEVFNKKVDDKLSVRCLYDVVMGAFIVRLFKESDNLETGIGLRIDPLRLVMILFPRLESVVNRYAQRDMYMTYRFQISKLIYLTVGQNSPKYGGKKYIDIREHFLADDSVKLIPTKIGIRFPIEILQKFKAVVQTCLDETSRLMKQSSEVYNGVRLFLIEKDIRVARFLQNKCTDCKVDHADAMRHKKTGLCQDDASWLDVVQQGFDDAVKGTRRSEVIRLANKVSQRMGELPFCTEEIKETEDEELKRSLQGIVRINKGSIYKHMTEIIKEEEEEETKKQKDEKEEGSDTDLLSEEEEEEEIEQPKKKKMKVQEEEETINLSTSEESE